MSASLPDGSGGPHTFVEDLEHLELSEAAIHHLRRVRRLRDGDPITVSDGVGSWRAARFGDVPEPDGEVHVVDRPRPPITIGLAAVKGDRTSWAVQKLTELGVDRVVLIETSRSVVRWREERAAKAIERLSGVARGAAEQSRQVWIPTIEGPIDFANIGSLGRFAIAQRGGSRPSLDHPTLLIGPEGGWSEGELEASEHRVDLGPGVLRAETAAVAAGTLLCGIRNDLVHRHAE